MLKKMLKRETRSKHMDSGKSWNCISTRFDKTWS